MDGITILNVIEATRGIPEISLYVASLGFLLLGLLISYFAIKDSSSFLLFLVMACLGGTLVCLELADEVNTAPTTIQITMDDTVNAVEFLDKYEVISKDGDIYTVTDREKE